MTEIVQPLVSFNINVRTIYPGLNVPSFDVQIGTGTILPTVTSQNQQWILQSHTAAGDDAFANILGAWGMVHSLLDPLIQGPNHILVFQETLFVGGDELRWRERARPCSKP